MSERHRPVAGPDHLVAGRYRLRAKLGGGGMGAVWLAHDRLLDREVAVKQITSTLGLDDAEANRLRERVLHEGRIAAKLSHVHAIGMYDVALDGGEPWLVMEYLPSRSLAQALNIIEALAPYEVAQIGIQVADALTVAHTAGILHRDIKPGNILVADRGRHVGIVKIGDFGIAQAENDTAETDHDTDVITGTLAYLAPELARGEPPTEASDVFSLGATLYTVLEGQPPFGLDADPDELFERVAKAQIITPRHDGALTDALLHMLEPDPQRRPDMAGARDELAVAALGAPGSVGYLIGSPIRSEHGEVPDWALRSALGRRRHIPAAGQRPALDPARSVAPPVPPPIRRANPPTLPVVPLAITAAVLVVLIVIFAVLLL